MKGGVLLFLLARPLHVTRGRGNRKRKWGVRGVWSSLLPHVTGAVRPLPDPVAAAARHGLLL